MTKQTNDALVAAFLAKGGQIKKVPEGERSLDPQDLWRARHSSNKLRGDVQPTTDPINQSTPPCYRY
jgi:hypothetical protein